MLRYMDNRELAIAGIKSLRMVHFYQLIKDNESIPALMAYYDKDKLINLCILDEHFDKLLDKVLEVYARERGTGFLVADEYSDYILKSSVAQDTEVYNRLTGGCSEVKSPLYEHRGYMGDIVTPAVMFVIDELYGMSGQKLTWNPLKKDWFGTGEMSAMNDERMIHFPYRIICVREGLYRIETGNVLQNGNKMTIVLKYGRKGIEIEVKSSLYPVEGSINYMVSEESLVCVADVKIAGKQAYISNDPIMSSDITLSEKIRERVNGLMPERKNFLLPWGAKLLYQRKENTAGEFMEAECVIAYLAEADKGEYIYCMAYKDLWSDRQTGYSISDFALDMIIDNRVDGHTQLHFCDMGYESRGYYKDKLENHFFIIN